jgi:PAS domain S-box-containing protein
LGLHAVPGGPGRDAFRPFFEKAPGAFLLLDPSLRVIGASDLYLSLTMTRRADILGRHLFDVFPDNPEDPEATGVRNLRASLERVIASRRADTMAVQRYDVRRPAEEGGDFEERWWKPRNVPVLDEENVLLGIVHSVEEVTQEYRLDLEREQEARARALEAERFRALSRATREAIWDWRPADGGIEWNENLSLTYGVPEADVAAIEGWLKRIHPDDRERIRESLAFVFRGEEELWSEEYRFIRGDGSVAHVFDRGLVLRDGDGRPVRMVGTMQDISGPVESARELERLRAEAADALREHRLFLEHSLDILVSIGADGRCLRVSDAVRTILGFEPDELIGRDLLDLVHPDDRASTAQIRDEVRAGAPVSTFRNRILRKDGRHTPIMWSSVWIPDEGITYAVGRDITGLVAAEQEIRRLGEHLETTLENITQACCTFDRDWRILYLNRQFEAFVGRSREELTGKVFWEEFPDGIALPLREQCERAMREAIPVDDEIHVPERSAWYEVTAHPTPDGVALLFRDVTARRRGAERIEEQAAAIEQAQDAIIIRDLDDRIRSWNAGAARLYGYRADEAVGRRIDELLHIDHERFRRASEIVRRRGWWSGELALRRADGSEVVVDARWSLLRREDGVPRAILVINTDLTERKRMEGRFLRAQRLESLGRLAGGIAHDLNNVLTPILVAIGLLRESVGEDADALETLDTMEESANRGAEMVQQVLAFARGVEGRRVPVALAGILAQLRRMIDETFPPGIELVVEEDPAAWNVVGDRTQLHQLLLNLCVNARDAMEEGGGTITIRVRNVTVDEDDPSVPPRARPGRFVCLEVADTGPGIPPSLVDRVFEPFFTTKELGRGTGLGLSTVQAIVQGHGGWVDLRSEEGRGSVFSIHLPADPDAALEPVSVGAGAPLTGRGELILVVDDEESIRTVSRRSLEASGYRVLAASDGIEALELYGRHPGAVDLVLTDIMMPYVDGGVFIRRLRRMDPGVRILATSGVARVDARSGGTRPTPWSRGGDGVVFEAGVGFLPKPYTAEAMLVAVRRALDGEAVG